MQYNEDLFNICLENYLKIHNTTFEENDTLKVKKELLKIIIVKLKNCLNSKTNFHNGILKIKFRSRYSGETDDGYNEILQLIKTGQFDSFASEFCLYLRNIEYRKNKNIDAYFEIIWDYKTYYESFSTKQDELFQISMNHLSIETKTNLLKKFTQEIKKAQKLEKQKLLKERCANNNHNFGNWKEINYKASKRNPYLDSRDYYVPKGYEYITVTHTRWERRCLTCGFLEVTEKEPLELIKEREKRQKQEQIKKLERKLTELKSEN